jgi:glycosyltransferase involved in cell wall biosynthesis
MRVFCLAPNENWIVDRFCDEFERANPDIVTRYPMQADVIWLVADWCADQLPDILLSKKKVVASVHHVVPEKFDKQKALYERLAKHVDVWHVPCQSTADFVRSQIDSKKPIVVLPFWANQKIWFEKREETSKMKTSFAIPADRFVVSSFQRDTEGHDLVSPKLEKGPDLFCDAVEALQKQKGNVHVLLGGWRRQYVINRLSKTIGVDRIRYVELPDQATVLDMYAATDLYIVAARCEGGPQAIVECALTKTPIVSTNVGVASYILSPEAIGDVGSDLTVLKPNVDAAFHNVQKFCLPYGMVGFRNMLNELVKA